MNKNILKLFLLMVAVVWFYPAMASAADTAVFDKLSNKGYFIANGLIKNGYIIAGVALIAFSFAAVFGKIQWKTLGYIMMCCFFLSALTAIATYVTDPTVTMEGHLVANGAGGDNSIPGNTQGVNIKK